MSRKVGRIMVVLVLAVPVWAAGHSGSLSGCVRNSAGVPQMGAAVKIFGSAATEIATLFTDGRGFYSARGLIPGVYAVKVSAPLFLPSMRENVSVRAGTRAVVNLTLNTLSEAVQMMPVKRVGAQDEDDWRWTLRSVANRPILRVLDSTPVVVASQSDSRTLKGKVAFVAGSQAGGFGSTADMSTQFQVEQSMFSTGTLALNGSVGRGAGPPTGVLRAEYLHQFSNGSHPQFALTARHFATPEAVGHSAALDALAFTLSDGITLGNVVELDYGGDTQAVQFRTRVTAFRPFGSVAVHLSPNTVVQYRYATSEPNTRLEKGFDSAPADLSESGPRMSLAGSVPILEHARHHELSVSRRMNDTSVQLAAYSDHISNAALVGVGVVSSDSGPFLPDIYSGTFSYNGGELATNGLRAVLQRKLSSDLTVSVDYAFGGVIDFDHRAVEWQDAQLLMRDAYRHALAAKFSGNIPHCKTRWIASYKWTSGPALTPVDLFDVSAGQAEPYFNIFIRQPLPATSFLPGKLEVLVDIRNLLAQGYIPIIAQDNQTVYLVQTARAVRGGLAFTF